MTLPHTFKLLKLVIDDREFQFIKESALIAYQPRDKHLKIELKYFTGETSSFFGITTREKKKLDFTSEPGKYEIVVQVTGDEQIKQTKNLGGGALLGAVIAGPVGAAAGAFIGSKLRVCPCIIKIPKHGIRMEAQAPVGYLKEKSQNEFFLNN